MLTPTPLVSVQVLTCNSSKYLEPCLNSIINQDYPNLEVIIIDCGSTDTTSEIVGTFSSRVTNIFFFEYRNSSIGFARQKGIEHSSGEYIAFIDSDCILPSRSWLSRMLYGFNAPNVAGTWVLGKYRKEDLGIMRYSILSHPLRGHEPPIVGKENYVPIGTGHTIIRKDLINNVGGFRDIKAAEDIELTYSLVNAGYVFRYMPGNEVVHYHVTSLRQLINKMRRNITGGINSPVWISEHLKRNRKDIVMELSMLYPVYFALTMMMKDRDIAWFWHPVIILSKYIVAGEVYTRKCLGITSG